MCRMSPWAACCCRRALRRHEWELGQLAQAAARRWQQGARGGLLALRLQVLRRVGGANCPGCCPGSTAVPKGA